MSLWRHESSSCRKPRLSTEHCCRLHTLAIFCRPPGPASAAAPRTPSRVARGRARTRGLGVAPPAGGGAGAGPASPRGVPGVFAGAAWARADPALTAERPSDCCTRVSWPQPPPPLAAGKAPSRGWSSPRPQILRRFRSVPQGHRCPYLSLPGTFCFLN